MADLEALVDSMTLAEQVTLLSGADFWSVVPQARLGLGTLRVTDGPNGARGGGSLIGGVTAAAFPVGIALGASWNPALAHQIGAALAAEVKSKGAHVLLAPTVNIQRSVTNGRNFECYSEDPTLTAALAVAYIRGLQGQGVGATIKHFAGNESEIERTTVESVIDERALREVYLRPFEDAVKKAGTWAVMSSYNRLNGHYAAENRWLLWDVLRGDWGHDGIVMSDWFGSRSTAPTINAGLDLEMPGPTRDRGDKLLDAVAEGQVSAQTVRARALAMLRLMDRTGALSDHRPHHERAEDLADTRALIRRAGAEGAVLLKNDGLLPLAQPREGRIAVIGPNAETAQIMGGGSAQLNPHYAISPLAALSNRLGQEALAHAPGCTNHRWEPLLKGRFRVEFFAAGQMDGTPLHVEEMTDLTAFWIPPVAGGAVSPTGFSARVTGSFTPQVSGLHRVGLVATGPARVLVDGKTVADARQWAKGRTFFEEGCDEVVGEVALTAHTPHQVVLEFTARAGDNLQFSGVRVGIGRPLGDVDIAAAAALAAGMRNGGGLCRPLWRMGYRGQ